MTRGAKILITIALAVVFALVVAAISGHSAPTPQEGTAAACDNNAAGKSKSVDHTCACAHATHCNPNDPKDRQAHEQMGPDCKTYCEPDHCKCTNECD